MRDKDPLAHYVKAAALLRLYGSIFEVRDHSKLFLDSPGQKDEYYLDARNWKNVVELNLERWSIDRLPDLILIKVLQYLPFRERMRAEAVCKRWNGLVKKYGWSNFRYFVPHCYLSVTEYKSKCLPFFNRCAPHLYGLSLAQFGMCPSLLNQLLPSLVKLQHLNLGFMDVNNAVLESIAKALPNLKSVAFSDFDSNVAPGLSFFMKTCTKLELLCLHGDSEFFDFEFTVLPPSLKCLDVCSFVPYHNILRQAALLQIQLEALVVRCVEDSVAVVDTSFYVSSLKYLEVVVNAHHAQNFVTALGGLSNLCALELEIGEDVKHQMTVQILDGIASNCKHLQHLSIKFYKTQYDENLFDTVAEKLTNIKSLVITGNFEINKLAYLFESDTSRNNPVIKLMETICSYGKLEHFHTDATIPLDSLLSCISKCKKLATITIGYYSFDAENESDKITEYLGSLDDTPLKVVNKSLFSSQEENPVREHFRTGCLSAGKPRFFF